MTTPWCGIYEEPVEKKEKDRLYIALPDPDSVVGDKTIMTKPDDDKFQEPEGQHDNGELPTPSIIVERQELIAETTETRETRYTGETLDTGPIPKAPTANGDVTGMGLVILLSALLLLYFDSRR